MKKAPELKKTDFQDSAELCVSFSDQSEYIRMAFCSVQGGEKEMSLLATAGKQQTW